ncbi:MAG: glycosyl hydrolase family 65 protein [Candidatus Kappaea frigidicola]|nr:glycosyl hydrolase family 65 protein [Candidatus Kappaea frigidicola]
MRKLLAGNDWIIEEKLHDFSHEKQEAYESIFTLGNSYMGIRGIFEESPEGYTPGTFIAGVFDKSVAQVEELINLPNPLDMRIASQGEKLDVRSMKVLKHSRCLDLKNGLLYRNTTFKDAWGRKINYESTRFVSYANHHLIAMRVKLTAVNAPMHLIVQDCIDDSVSNQGGILEGRKRHVKVVEADGEANLNYLCMRSYTYKTWIAYSTLLSIKRGRKKELANSRVQNIFLKKNESVTLTKYITIHTSRHISRKKIKAVSSDEVKNAHRRGFEKLLKDHKNVWSQLWNESDVIISGDKDIQKAVRFNIYHLLIAAGRWSKDVSVPAKTLSGEGYRGHVFWDTEIFIMPFFNMTDPEVSKKLLLYRYRRLDKARQRAQKFNCKGALFPWESAATGIETTPSYSKDLDGTIIKIHTQDYEQHISADIAYAIYNYILHTDDKGFLLKYGIEMVFETARFYASRVEYNKAKDRYDINGVIGPDEFHINVNNNAFTNYMAKWNLLYAVALNDYYGKKARARLKKIRKKVGVTEKEVASWFNIAQKIYFEFSKKNKLIEQFDGYFKKKSITISEWERDFIPSTPKVIPFKNIGATQFVKQADVVMLFFLFPQNFSEEQIKKNYYYYVERTLHKSSLSPSVHATVASWMQDNLRAYVYFIYSVLSDLQNKHGNTGDGIHGASLGGTYQAVIRGFGGVVVDDLGIQLKPNLPRHWKALEFKIRYRNFILNFNITKKHIKVSSRFYKKINNCKKVKLTYDDQDYHLEPGGKIVIGITEK